MHIRDAHVPSYRAHGDALRKQTVRVDQTRGFDCAHCRSDPKNNLEEPLHVSRAIVLYWPHHHLQTCQLRLTGSHEQSARGQAPACTCSNVPDHTMFLPAICLAADPGDRPDCCICCKSRARLSSHDIPRGAALHPSDSSVPDPLPASPASFSASLPADPGPHLGKRERGAALERALSSTLNWEGASCAPVSE